MFEVSDTLPRRLFFLSSTILVAINLIVVSLVISARDKSPNPLEKALYSDALQLSRSAATVLRASAYVAAIDTNLTAFVKPAQVRLVAPVASVAAHPAQSAPTTTPPAPAPSPTTAAASHPSAAAVAIPASTPLHTTNAYAWGNCTWWVAIRRAQINDPIPNSWGDAATWAERAQRDGYVVDHQPRPGAIMQTPYSGGGLGHVAFVESVDSDGTWHISEMNVVGLDVIDHRALPASTAMSYSFIHDKN